MNIFDKAFLYSLELNMGFLINSGALKENGATIDVKVGDKIYDVTITAKERV